MNIALIGPSGVGKGTHASRLISTHRLLHLSTGDLLRENLAGRSALGLLARKYMTAGELVPDEVVDAMIEERMHKTEAAQGLLLDGFPRTVQQAQFLDELLPTTQRQFDAAIYLQAADETIVGRLSGRLICRKCQTPYHTQTQPPAKAGVCDRCGGEVYRREDDEPNIVAVRLRVFHRSNTPLLEFYQQSGRLVIINAEGGVDTVFSAINSALAAVQNKPQRFATAEEVAQLRKPAKAPAAPPRAVAARMDIVLLGGPGSGKGTQAEHLSRSLKIQHVATGDLFRENLKNKTPLGKLAQTYMDRGELVPDDVTEAMVQERLARPDTAAGFLLDGFPRTLPQAEALSEMITTMGRPLAGVIYINVSDEDIVGRLSGRLICRGCQTPYHLKFKPPTKPGVCDRCGGELYQRDDDNPGTVRARLKTFHAQTEPVVEFYRKDGLIFEVDGQGDVATVTGRTNEAVKKIAAKR
ncbi:MAG: adenylate kinase [Verrucomicrobia bacterium]|nr:adenylate kinase [Verrucomicrobiota bacterium]